MKTMASSLLALSDLINFQLERIKVEKLFFKDELHLQKQLMELDPIQDTTYARRNEYRQELWHLKKRTPPNQNQNQNSRGLQVSESLGYIKDKSSTPPWLSGTSVSAGASIAGNDTDGSITTKENKECRGSRISINSGGDTTDTQKGFRSLVLQWFRQMRDQTEDFKSDDESKRLREAGNTSYRKEKHPLKACDFYTEAIFRAPVDSTAAAMAHANRSTVLHDYGMYEQSYDDCLCALDLGYPEEFVPLIKIRQATCALKLRKFDLCEMHLHELLHMELSEAFEERTHEIWRDCEAQKTERTEIGTQCNGDDFHTQETKVYEVAWKDNSTILTTNVATLRASKNIASNTIVCHEEAFVIVPSGQTRICDNCAVTQFIPFPCILCSNRAAVYCSRKCRAAHASLHAIECFAHRIELFEELGEIFSKPRLLQLSLRMLTTGLPQVVSHCRKKPTVSKMWAALNGVLTDRSDIPYSAILRLETRKDRDDIESLVACAVIAQVIAIYLAECTDFFDHLEQTMPVVARITYDEWQLLSAALLHRHIDQLRYKNLVHLPNFVLPANPRTLAPVDEFTIWADVKRLRCGHLHLLAGNIAAVGYGVFPDILALCRHSCDDVLVCRFSGRKLTTYATTDICAGETIYNCFTTSGNYRQSLQETRREELQALGIDCKCEKCQRPHPDEDFLKFHRYRCDNPNCMQIFTPPPLKNAPNLRWWNSDYFTQPEKSGSEILVCSICKETQKLEWFWSFTAALIDCDLIQERCKLYAALERAETQIVDMHECKVELARQLVEQCLLTHREGPNPLDAWEFNKLGSVMRKALQIVAAQYRVFSLEYVRYMSYFWDIMALSDYKCSDKELMQMLQAIEFIPDEFKEIFINYYEDFISPKYASEETYASLVDTQVTVQKIDLRSELRCECPLGHS